MKILGPNETGKGILIEWDAGYVSPNDKYNSEIIKESKNFLMLVKSFVWLYEFFEVLRLNLFLTVFLKGV